MHGGAALTIGIVTVIVAVSALGYILWSITDYSEKCKTETLDICETFSGPSFPFLLIVLIIAGLVLVSSTVVYILVTA